MPLLALLSRDAEVQRDAMAPLAARYAVARAASWERLEWFVRERPVVGVVLDAGALKPSMPPAAALAELRTRFPSLGLVLVARREMDPLTLFHLGRAGIDRLLLTQVDDLARDLPGQVARALQSSTEALVTRAVSPYLPAAQTRVLRLALDGVHRRWSADDLAGSVGFSREHLSVRLKEWNLPSTGHLLVWCRLLHAGRWLADPGRTAESVSRQLEYANGAVFRRALRNYLSATPTEVREGGGLRPVLNTFLDRCGLRRPVAADLHVA